MKGNFICASDHMTCAFKDVRTKISSQYNFLNFY